MSAKSSTKASSTETSDGMSLSSFRKYMEYKLPFSMYSGGIVGTSIGYYMGENVMLYCGVYSLGSGFFASSFYSTTYVLSHIRSRDDIFNYAISGSFNTGWMMALSKGYKRGAYGALLGGIGGLLYKSIGDQVYHTSREAWLASRRHRMDHSITRILDVRKPKFHPKDSQLPEDIRSGRIRWTGRSSDGGSIIPKGLSLKELEQQRERDKKKKAASEANETRK